MTAKYCSEDIRINGVILEVEYDYYPGCSGIRDSFGGKPGAGPPLTPDEDEEIEIISVKHLGEDITFLIGEDGQITLVEELFKIRDSKEPPEPYVDDNPLD